MSQFGKVGFIGIGAQKSATSWLHHVLSAHSEIVGSESKELNYFTANYNRCDVWYENQFATAPDNFIRGECSPTYFFSGDAVERAYRYNPDFRLIAVLRDSVARAFSNHLHELRKGHIPEGTSFEEELKTDHAYTEQSQNRANLTRWLTRFNRESLLVLLAEDVAETPEVIFRLVCQHIGVSSDEIPEGLSERQHESVANRSDGLQRKLRAAGDMARSVGMDAAVKRVKQTQPIRGLLALNKRDLRKNVTPMLPETEQALGELFCEDVSYVAELVGRKELPWATLGAKERAENVC
jgi:hypothetical protein